MLIVCTNCQGRIRVPENAEGKKGRCPKCGTVLDIPAAEPEVPPALPVESGYAAEPPAAPSSPPPIPKPSRYGDRDEDEPPARRRRDEDDEDDEDDRPRRRDDEEEDRPRRRDDGLSIGRPRQPRGLSIASMVLGISGLVILLLSGGATIFGAALLTCACPLGCIAGPAGYVGIGLSAVLAVVAVPLGFFGMSRGGRGMAIAGIATGIVTLLLCALVLVLTFIFGVGLAVAGANAPPPRGPQPFPPRRF